MNTSKATMSLLSLSLTILPPPSFHGHRTFIPIASLVLSFATPPSNPFRPFPLCIAPFMSPPTVFTNIVDADEPLSVKPNKILTSLPKTKWVGLSIFYAPDKIVSSHIKHQPSSEVLISFFDTTESRTHQCTPKMCMVHHVGCPSCLIDFFEVGHYVWTWPVEDIAVLILGVNMLLRMLLQIVGLKVQLNLQNT